MINLLAFTWSQADWGLLRSILEPLAEVNDFGVLVYPFTDDHYSQVINTVNDRIIVIQPDEDTVVEPMGTMFGSAAAAVDRELGQLRDYDVDHVLILGDRLMELAVATVVSTYRLPIHHLFAGDRSGCLDDRYRDAITSLCNFAYAFSKEAYKRTCAMRLLMGHRFKAAHCNMPPECASDEYVKTLAKAGIKDYVLVRFHPETAVNEKEQIDQAMSRVLEFSKETGAHILWLPPNRDDGWADIMSRWMSLEESYDLIHGLPTLPRDQYLGVLQHAALIVGNSSSFVHDAPLVGRQDVVQLIGHRQHRRTPMDGDGVCVLDALQENLLSHEND